MKIFYRMFFIVVIAMVPVPGLVHARLCSISKTSCFSASECNPSGQTCDAENKDYCVTPPFISAGVQPNLLLMIDNSAGMYDLAYADEGQRDGRGNLTRQPYYCYDQTYQTNVCSSDSSRSCSADTDCAASQTCLNVYAGYFKGNTRYEYDFTNQFFYIPTVFPNAADCSKYITNTLCVGFESGTGNLNKFVAKGNYLNWLAASRFDVEKQILNGGKYVSRVCSGNPDRACLVAGDCLSGQTCDALTTRFIQGETRGCLGRGFIKDALATNYINYPSTSVDPNKTHKLGVAFLITGPEEVSTPAPSQGGQTCIKLFEGDYNAGNCQKVIELWNKKGVSQKKLSDALDVCINYNSKAPDSCKGDPVCSGLVKAKIALSEATDTCRQSNNKNGSLDISDIAGLTTGGKCTDVYAASGVCSGNHSNRCGVDGDCQVTSGLGGTCLRGPAYLLSGNRSDRSQAALGVQRSGSGICHVRSSHCTCWKFTEKRQVVCGIRFRPYRSD